jgi:beta-1,4-N-acetylglucosaminyltransferase
MVHKLCLVTVGATAPFEKLIQAVLHESFIAELEKYDFTRLLIQYGKGGQPIFDSFRAEYEKGNITHDIQIGGFDLRPNMTPYVCMAREDPSMAQELGMMISHAGE